MPGRDNTGPFGAGPLTGRGLGSCNSENRPFYSNVRFGLGCRRGFKRGNGRGYGMGLGYSQLSNKTQKELLEEQRNLMKNRIDLIDKELENL